MNLRTTTLAGALLACGACAGPRVRPESGQPVANAGQHNILEGHAEGAFVTTASGGSEAQALAAAREAATRQYFGQASVPPELHATFEAHLHVEPLATSDAGTQARAWVDNGALQTAVAAKLAEAPAATEPVPPFLTTAQIKAAVQVLEAATAQASWCALYVRTGGEACPDDGRGDRMRAALSQTAQSLTLRLVPEGGTPYKPGHPPYRPLVLEAVVGPPDATTPWAHLPVRVQAPPDLLAAQSGTTDAQGRWDVPWQRVLHPSDVITAHVDTQALLGAAYAPLMNASPVAVKTRALTWKTARVLVALKSSAHSHDPLVELARARVLESLSQQVPGATLASSATSVAKDGHGQLTSLGYDVLLQADIGWAFASALGGRSVWYEARAAFEGFNLWSQDTFATAQPSVQEAGIGDKHAAKQAVNKLAMDVAKHMADALKAALPDSL